MEKKSPNRTLAEIISDTRSGDPLLKKDSGHKGHKRRRTEKADEKKDKVIEKAAENLAQSPKSKVSAVVKEDDSDDNKEANEHASKPQLMVVDGKTIVVNPKVITMSSAIANMKTLYGPSVIQNSDRRISPFDYKPKKSTDRWSKQDTQKFYMALQLFGTDFEMIKTLFEDKRTRN